MANMVLDPTYGLTPERIAEIKQKLAEISRNYVVQNPWSKNAFKYDPEEEVGTATVPAQAHCECWECMMVEGKLPLAVQALVEEFADERDAGGGRSAFNLKSINVQSNLYGPLLTVVRLGLSREEKWAKTFSVAPLGSHPEMFFIGLPIYITSQLRDGRLVEVCSSQ